MKQQLFLLIGAFVVLSGCNVRQEVIIGTDAGGTTTMEISLDSVLTSYIRDLAASVGAPSDASIFDTAEIRESFAERPGVTAERVEASEENTLHLELSFADIAEVVASGEDTVQRLVSVQQSDGATTLSFRVTPQTVRDALRLSPMYGSQATSFLLPPAESTVTAEAYTEQLAWALEEYEEDRPISEIVMSSMITLDVRVRGEVISQRGGTRISESAVRFEVPVVELITVQGERRYELSFR